MHRGSLQVIYRDYDRTPLLYVLKEMAARHEDLDVRVEHRTHSDPYDSAFLAGEVDLVCESFRFLLAALRDRHPVRCLGVTHNFIVEKLLVRPDVRDVGDLAGKVVALRGTESTQLTSRHWLKHLGLEGKVTFLIIDDSEVGRWRQWVKVASGEADAVICSPLYLQPALEAGLQLLDADPLPQIGPLYFAALGPFVATHDDELRRFIRALYRALSTFHNDADTTLGIMRGEPARLMRIENDKALRLQYETLRSGLDTRPVPLLAALNNTFAMLNEEMGGLDGVNPMALFDLHYVLELEESRFLEQLAKASRS